MIRKIIFILTMFSSGICAAELPVHSFSLPVSKSPDGCKKTSTPLLQDYKASFMKGEYGGGSCTMGLKETHYQFCYFSGVSFLSGSAECKVEYSSYLKAYMIMSEAHTNSAGGTCHFMCLVK